MIFEDMEFKLRIFEEKKIKKNLKLKKLNFNEKLILLILAIDIFSSI